MKDAYTPEDFIELLPLFLANAQKYHPNNIKTRNRLGHDCRHVAFACCWCEKELRIATITLIEEAMQLVRTGQDPAQWDNYPTLSPRLIGSHYAGRLCDACRAQAARAPLRD